MGLLEEYMVNLHCGWFAALAPSSGSFGGAQSFAETMRMLFI